MRPIKSGWQVPHRASGKLEVWRQQDRAVSTGSPAPPAAGAAVTDSSGLRVHSGAELC